MVTLFAPIVAVFFFGSIGPVTTTILRSLLFYYRSFFVNSHFLNQAVQALVMLRLTDCSRGKKCGKQFFLPKEQFVLLFRGG